MYIKIKYIKLFSLAFATIFFACWNYLSYVQADNNDSNTSNTSTTPGNNETAEFAQQLNDYLNSKKGQSVSSNDVQNFSSQFLADKSAPIDYDNLPDVDRSQIKVLKQPYDNLSADDKKARLRTDAGSYIEKMAFLLFSNSPVPIQNKEDMQKFYNSFLTHFQSLSTSSPDTEYFSDLGNRLDMFLSQVNSIEVPETMLDLHIKFLRILKGVSALKNEPAIQQDPVAEIVLVGKIQGYISIMNDFIQNDFFKYADQINN